MPVSNTDNPRIDIPGAIDPKQLEALRKSLEGPEQAPTTRDQSPSGVDWKRLSQQLGAPFDPTQVPTRKLREMREDPMISFALHYILVTQARADWHMDARDKNGPNPQVAAFMDAAWRQIHARYMMQHGGGTLSFGYQALAQRFQLGNPGGVYIDPVSGETKPAWDEGTVLPRIWKTFVALEPERVTPRFIETGVSEGDFDGIDLEINPAQRGQRRGVKTRKSTGNQNIQQIDLFHSLWATNDRDSVFGSVYGRPRIRHAYRYWWSYWWRWGQYDRAFERMAIPPIVAYHPDGSWTDPETQEKIPYQQIALTAAERLRSNAIAAVPSTLASSGLDEKGTQKREWEFEFLEPKGGVNFQHFDVAFNYLDVMKLRSIWVPEQAFIEGGGGTSSRNVAEQMGDIFVESQALLWEDIADHINRYILPQILLINFPEFVANGGTCRIVANGFKSSDIEFLKQIIQLAGQADATFLGEVDFREALRRIDIPLKSPEQYSLERARVAREQRQAGPGAPVNGGRRGLSVVPVNPGQTNGGSMPEPGNSLGFSDEDTAYAYVRPIDFIELTDTEEFIASLPNTHHYDDRSMKALAVQMRRAWQSHFRNAYPDFAEHLETIGDFEFADDDKLGVTKKSAIKAANKIVREWSMSQDLVTTVTERSRNIIERMVARGTRLAQKRTNIAAEQDNEAITSWVDNQVAKLIKRTSDTMKDELHAFLVGQIREGKTPREVATEVRRHFSDFNGWKADRVARSETRDAANAAVLMHGQAAGLKWVRMSDGEEFDRDCQERNGKLATIREAWKAMKKAHPNCTLGFDLIPRANFSIEYKRTVPTFDGEERFAYFDDENDTAVVYVGLADEEIDSFFFDLGKALLDPRTLGKPKTEVLA